GAPRQPRLSLTAGSRALRDRRTSRVCVRPPTRTPIPKASPDRTACARPGRAVLYGSGLRVREVDGDVVLGQRLNSEPVAARNSWKSPTSPAGANKTPGVAAAGASISPGSCDRPESL